MPIGVTSRITSENIRLEWLPGSIAPAIHVQVLNIDAAVDGGTFKLRVNGEQTAIISAVNLIAAQGTTFTTTFASDLINATSHGLAAGTELVLNTTAADLPDPLVVDTVYYVINPNADDFQLSLTVGGAAIDLLDDGTGTHRYDTQVAAVVANVQAALDALPNLTADDITVTGSVLSAVTLTATQKGNFFFRILISDDSLTQLIANVNVKIATTVTTQGSILAVLSAQATSFSWERSVEVVDVTAISEYDRTEIPTAEAVSFDLSLYKLETGSEDWVHSVYSGNNGVLTVYPEGKTVGKEIYQMQVLIESVGEDYPDHEKVEMEISGMRQGAFLIEPNSIYRG